MYYKEIQKVRKRLVYWTLPFLVMFMLFSLLSFIGASPVYAIGNPDNLTIKDVYAFRNYKETGDRMYYMRYEVGWSETPSETPQSTWLVTLYNSDATLILGTSPIYYWGNNIISVWISPADVVAKSVAWEGEYLFRIHGSPLIYADLIEGSNMLTEQMVAGDYYETTSLETIMRAQAILLENDLGIDLISDAGRLNSAGNIYFLTAMPYLGTAAPGLFQSVTQQIVLDYTEYNENYTQSLVDRRSNILEEMVTDWGVNFWHMSYDWAAVWMVGILYLVVAGAIYPLVKNPAWSLIGAFPIPVASAWLGISDSMLRIIVLIVMGLAFLFGVFFILPRFG